jgi:hypothetical protein
MLRLAFLFRRVDLFHQCQAFHGEAVPQQILHALFSGIP